MRLVADYQAEWNDRSIEQGTEGSCAGFAFYYDEAVLRHKAGIKRSIEVLKMKMISTRLHGVLDYLTVPTVLALPKLVGAGQSASRMLTGAALSALAYSLFTRYELGLVKAIPMKGHLALDAGTGALLCAAAMFMGNEKPASKAALAGVGLYEIAAAAMTEQESEAVSGEAFERSSRQLRTTLQQIRQAPARRMQRQPQ